MLVHFCVIIEAGCMVDFKKIRFEFFINQNVETIKIIKNSNTQEVRSKNDCLHGLECRLCKSERVEVELRVRF